MIEQGVEATVSGGTTTYSSSTTLSLEGTSDRSSGSDTITGFVRYNQPFDSTVAEDIEFGGTLSSSFDFADGWRGTVDGSVDRQRESATAPVALPGVPDRPYRTLASGTLGLEKTVGKARGRLVFRGRKVFKHIGARAIGAGLALFAAFRAHQRGDKGFGPAAPPPGRHRNLFS